MTELWDLLVSAQENDTGIPEAFLQQKKDQIKKRLVITVIIFFFVPPSREVNFPVQALAGILTFRLVIIKITLHT